MKLNATLKNNRGGKKNTADDTRILIELSYKNKIVGEIGLYAIIDDKVEGYRIVWNDPDKGFSDNNVLKEIVKGKTQKDGCEHDELYYKYGAKCSKCGEQLP
jgi:hypothetical protein